MNHEKSRILAQLRAFRETKPGPFWATIGLTGISLFGMVAAFGTVPSTFELQLPRQSAVVEQLAITPAPNDATVPPLFAREERIERGDTVATLFARLGIQDEPAVSYLSGNPVTQPIFRQLRPGKIVTARIGEGGALNELIFPLNGDGSQALVVTRQGGSFTAVQQALALETQTEIKSGEISYSLFGATDAAGIPDAVAVQMADIFAGDIDFHRDLRKGDRFSLTYEMNTYLGKPVRSGRILAAEFVNNGKTFRALWYQTPGGQGGYYTPEGKNIRKAFLRSPLEFSRVTSGFTTHRFHPLLKEWRAHKGVDYGAPIGTRVKATGDGIVEFVGNQGGYGRVIILRHQATYTTVYGHLSAYATNLRKGARVSQGDVIGYVGQSGWATGPHLHYEFRINNVHQNPLAVALPEAPPLAAGQQAQFVTYAREMAGRLDLVKNNTVASLD